MPKRQKPRLERADRAPRPRQYHKAQALKFRRRLGPGVEVPVLPSSGLGSFTPSEPVIWTFQEGDAARRAQESLAQLRMCITKSSTSNRPVVYTRAHEHY